MKTPKYPNILISKSRFPNFLISLMSFVIVALLCLTPAFAAHGPTDTDDCFKGGSGDGWDYTANLNTMYLGGSGDGDHVAAYSTDTAVGFGAANKLVFTTQPTNSVRNATLATSPVVQVRDASDNPVLSATDTITIAIANDASAGGNANLGGTTSKAASSGSATFSDLTIDQYGDGYTLSASSGSLTSATSNAFNVSYGAASQVVFSTQPTNSVKNATLATSPVIQIRDSAGNVVESETGTITVAIGTNPGSATLGGTTSKSAVSGEATFSDLTIDEYGDGYTLTASYSGLSDATSNSFNVSYGTASQIVFSTQPTNSVRNATLATSPVIQIRDAQNNVVESETGNITIAIGTNPGSATLGGTTTKAASAGSATFSDLTIDQYGTGYTLTADYGALTQATSSSFNVSYGTKTKLGFTTQPSNSFANTALITMPVVAIQDAQGNTVETATDTITLAAQAGAGGTLYTSVGGTPVTKAAVAGVADWTGSGIFIDLGGNNYTLLASATGLTSATSSTFDISTAPTTSAVSGSLATDGSGQVTISYTVTDAESNNCNLNTAANQVQYSLDNVSWSNATVSGTVSGITSSPTGTAHSDLIWEAGTDANNTEDSAVYFRIKIHDGTGYESDYVAVTNSFLLDTKAPTNVSISSPANNATDVTLTPTFTTTTASDLSTIQYKFQLATNIVFTTGLQTRDWSSSSSWAIGSALSTSTTYYVRVKVKDAYGNESSYCGSTVDTAGYTTFTTTETSNAKPTVSSISGSQLTDGSKKVLITYTVADAESNACDVTHATNQVQYSTDNSTWSDATVSGTTSSITTSSGGTTHNASNEPLYWEAGTDLNNTEDNTVYFRLKLHDGYSYQNDYETTSAFVLDTKAPVISSATAFSSSPVGGDTSITLTATWTEGNPNTSAFYYALDGTTYSSAQAGSTNTTTPTATISLGATLTGHSYFDKIKSTATDDYGNVSSASEVLTDVGVKPYQPAQPTVQNSTYTSMEVIPQKNASEASGLEYCIYVTPAISNNYYIAADGSSSATAVWQSLATWGTVTVTSLESGTTYTFKTKSRNADVTSVESDWSSTKSGSTQATGVATDIIVEYEYDASSDALGFHIWIERSGAIVGTSSGDTASVDIFDTDNNQLNSSSVSSTTPDSRGIWWLSWDPAAGTGMSENTNYLAKASVIYGGNTYTTSILVNITTSKSIADIETSVGSGLGAAVSAIQTSVGTGLATKVDTLQTDMTSVKTAVGAGEATTLYSQVTSILEDTGTTIPAAITSELKKGPRSKILNRPTTVNTGDAATIRYKTDSGLSPTITVYDADNTARVSSAAMTEIGTTGIYEYDVTFQSGWGTGDYTIICSEPTTSSADSIIIEVGTAGGLSGIETKIDTLTINLSTVSTNVSAINTVVGTTSDASTASTLYGKLSGVSTNVDSIVTKWGSYSASDVIGYVDTLESYLGSPSNTAGQQTVFGKIAEVYNQTDKISDAKTAATSAYNEIHELRKEVDFNGKSETAYNLVKSINETLGEVKELIAKASQETTVTEVEKMSTTVEETRKALKEMAAKEGLKGAVVKELPKGPATLEGLQNQISELRALMETMKAMLQKEVEEPVVKTWFESGSVVLKMIVANPSATETKTVPVKSYLPKGVEPEDIIDLGGFKVGYDFEQSLYYIYQDVTLGPKESVELAVEIKDIWIISNEEIESIAGHVGKITNVLEKTEYYQQAKILNDSILERLDEITHRQSAIGVSVEKRLSDYEMNVKTLSEVKRDLGALEDLAIEVGGLPGEKMIGEAKVSAVSVEDIDKSKMDLGTIKFKIAISNPLGETRIVPFEYFLPKEVTPQFIVDKGGLEVGYNYSKGLHYVYKEEGLRLEPGQRKEFTVEIKDIWFIPEAQIETLKSHTEKLAALLRETDFKESSAFLGEGILTLLNEIIETQNKKDVAAERHIGDYRRNVDKLEEARKTLAKLERMVIQAGGSPGLTLIGKGIGGKRTEGRGQKTEGGLQGTKGMELLGKSIFRGKAPTVTTTWKIIWLIVGFLALVSFLFFILWWTQIKVGVGKKKEEVKQEEKKDKINE